MLNLQENFMPITPFWENRVSIFLTSQNICMKGLYKKKHTQTILDPLHLKFQNLLLTHCGPVTPHGSIELGQHWLRGWHVAWLFWNISYNGLSEDFIIIYVRTWKKHRSLRVRWCVYSCWPWIWPVYSINYRHTIHYSCNVSNQNYFF